VPYPNTFSVSDILGLVASMLGMGGSRLISKIKGVDTKAVAWDSKGGK
jgi:hypothetical protein